MLLMIFTLGSLLFDHLARSLLSSHQQLYDLKLFLSSRFIRSRISKIQQFFTKKSTKFGKITENSWKHQLCPKSFVISHSDSTKFSRNHHKQTTLFTSHIIFYLNILLCKKRRALAQSMACFCPYSWCHCCYHFMPHLNSDKQNKYNYNYI